MKKTLNLRKILLIVFGFLFAISAAAFGLSLRSENATAADFDESDPSTYITSGESETFTYEDSKYVFASVVKEKAVTLSIKQETITYFKTLTQYDTLRITASLLGTDGTTIGYRCKGYDSTWGWTGDGQPLSRDFEIAGFADDKFDVTVCYGSSGSGSGFAVALELIEAPDYSDSETWFSDYSADVTHTKVGYNSYDFTRSENGGVLSFKGEALTWLVQKGYTKIRVTYIPKAEESAPNMTIYPDGEAWNTNPLWATKDHAQTKEFDITGGTAFSLHVAKTPSITEFNIKFKAINDSYNDFDAAENWFNVYNSDVTREQVSENGFDFERIGNGGVLSFKGEALTWLVQKGYTKIRVTYIPKAEESAPNMTIYPDGEAWNTNPLWATKDHAQTKEFDITGGTAFSLHVVKTDSITKFNIEFKAISGLKEVTVNYNVNGTLDNSQTITWKEENFAANMPTVSVADVKTFGYEYDGKLYKDVSSVFAAIGTPANTVTVNVIALRLETQDGAEIRASGTAGLRFTSLVGKSAHFSEFGMILTVRSNVDTNSENAKAVGIENFDKESLTAASLKYIDLVSTGSGFNSYEKNGNTVFNLVLTNISEAHLTMQYIARTYVTVKYADGTTVTYYSDVDFENNARAPQDVGYSALDNAELSGITEDQKAFIKENYLSKKA